MRIHRHQQDDEIAVAAPGAAAWWDGVPQQAAITAPVIHAARAAELVAPAHQHAA